ncbi:acyl carrier protein [Thiosocius teredinicola]|uniref:acyl carrier protein n=1 Tax=Thiosocius teredinicola TaxID=1973002 RepID=UPI0013DDDCF6
MSESTEQKVIELVAKHSETDVAQISADTNLTDTGIESVGVAELIFDLEEYFDITIEDTDDIQNRFNLGTIADIVKLIEKLRA